MQLSPYVSEVQAQLRAAAALGDDATRRVADALAALVTPRRAHALEAEIRGIDAQMPAASTRPKGSTS